jgi:hypothetical protein
VDGQSMTLPGNEDTIELVLTAEQLQDLSRAAEEAQGAAPAVAVVPPPAPVLAAPVPVAAIVIQDLPPPPRALRWHQTPIAKMAANTVAFVAFAWWSVSQLAGQPQAHPTAPIVSATRPVALVTHPAVAADLRKPTLQVANPFDKTEVFEFPAGTSADEGREKAAQILLQRARERQSHWEHIRTDARLRTASLVRTQ